MKTQGTRSHEDREATGAGFRLAVLTPSSHSEPVGVRWAAARTTPANAVLELFSKSLSGDNLCPKLDHHGNCH